MRVCTLLILGEYHRFIVAIVNLAFTITDDRFDQLPGCLVTTYRTDLRGTPDRYAGTRATYKLP